MYHTNFLAFASTNLEELRFQDFADSHSTSGHQLQHDPVPRLHGAENDLIHHVLFDILPLLGRPLSKHLPQHGRVARVLDAGVDRILEEVEKGLETEMPVALGGRFSGGTPETIGYPG